MNKKLTWFLKGVAIFACLAALMFVAVNWTNAGENKMRPIISTSTPTSAVKIALPIDLTGTWRYEENGVVFKAKVAQGMIDLKMTHNGTTMDYFYGSLENPNGNGEIMSTRDKTQLSWAQIDQKPFIYQDGSLVFDFKISGLTKAIEMKRVDS